MKFLFQTFDLIWTFYFICYFKSLTHINNNRIFILYAFYVINNNYNWS